MVEADDYGWEEDGEDDWGLNGDNSQAQLEVDMEMQGNDDKNNGFKLMHMNDIRISVKAKIEDL